MRRFTALITWVDQHTAAPAASVVVRFIAVGVAVIIGFVFSVVGRRVIIITRRAIAR